MALPKRKSSKARQGNRRSHLRPPTLVPCPQCHSLKLPHHVCPSCGSYRGREVVEIGGRKGREQ